MATSAEKSDPDDVSTAVLPRRLPCKRKRIPKPQREAHLELARMPKRNPPGLMKKIQFCIKRLENSEFSHSFFHRMQTPDFNDKFLRVLGSEPKMQMVIYGIGSIHSSECSRIQLSLAILMKKTFDWIGDMEVFDPVISPTESKVMESLGCSVLSINEKGRRQVLKPTLFFMPHCGAYLYENLLEANWTFDRLTRLLLLGNVFTFYEV